MLCRKYGYRIMTQYIYKINNISKIKEPPLDGSTNFEYIMHDYVISDADTIRGDVTKVSLTDSIKADIKKLLEPDYDNLSLSKMKHDLYRVCTRPPRDKMIDEERANIKAEAQRRIYDKYPLWKQKNLESAVLEVVHANQNNAGESTLTNEQQVVIDEWNLCKHNILAIRKQSNNIEDNLPTMTDDELEVFNVQDNKHWE
jgi:hypothetical protein